MASDVQLIDILCLNPANLFKMSQFCIIAGVMLSHDNIYWTAMGAAEHIKLREYVEVMVSYLPLSHVAANMVDIW